MLCSNFWRNSSARVRARSTLTGSMDGAALLGVAIAASLLEGVSWRFDMLASAAANKQLRAPCCLSWRRVGDALVEDTPFCKIFLHLEGGEQTLRLGLRDCMLFLSAEDSDEELCEDSPDLSEDGLR